MPDTRAASDLERHPALWLALSFGAGILMAYCFDVSLTASLGLTVAFTITAAALRSHGLATTFALAAFVFAGAASFQIQTSSIAENRIRTLYDSGVIRSNDPVELEGVLPVGPEPSHDGIFITVLTEKIIHGGRELDVSGQVRLFLPVNEAEEKGSVDISAPPPLRYGSRIRVAANLKREDEYLNPGVTQKKDMLDLAGIDATGSIKSSLMIERIADESVFLPLAWVYDQRTQLIYDLRRNLGGPASGVMIASLLGDRYFLDKETSEIFREGGTFHILVISGLHITFIGGLLLLLVSQFTNHRWLRFILPATFLWTYAIGVGAGLPVLRAAAMFTIISFSFVIYRQRTLLNSLGLSGLILLVLRPSELLNPSFQLTFVSVGAIVAMGFPLIEHLRAIGSWMPTSDEPFPPNVPTWLRRGCEMLYWNPDAWSVELNRQIWSMQLFKAPFLAKRVTGGVRSTVRYLFEGILVSLIVQIWMLPLLVIYFHRISTTSIFLNLWVGAIIALEGVATAFALLVNSISSTLAAPFFDLGALLNGVMLFLPRMIGELGWSSFRLPAYSGPGRAVYFLYFVPVLILAVILFRWRPFDIVSVQTQRLRAVLYPAFTALGIMACVIVMHPISTPRPDGRLHIDFLDVGQGDSAFVTFPDGTTLLVDGGGRFNYGSGGDDEEAGTFEPDIRGIGDAVVSEFLWHKGYSEIDFILGTHADADHIQGLVSVANNFTVGSAIFGRMPLNDPDFARLAKVLEQRGIPAEVVERGVRLEFGEAEVEVLHPIAPGDGGTENDNSLVVRIVYGSRSFLLTGDIERRAETDLVASGYPLTADVIKVAHHGSRTSSNPDLVNAVNAKYSIISVGRRSPFGHPHPEVVDRWRTAGSVVMTTGEKGTITVSTDGSDLKIETFRE